MDIRIAAYGVIVRDGQVLLAHWNWPEAGIAAWTLPGGGIDPCEDPADAAVREIREETGYEARLDALLGISSLVVPAEERISNPGVAQHNLRIIYATSIVGGELAFEVDGSTDEARWFPLDEVEALASVGLVAEGMRLWREYAGG